jgi:TPR repeat protein
MTYNLERRQSPRKRFQHLLYVELEPANGGMVLNFSEHGFGFRAVKRVRPNQEVKFTFNLDDKRRLEGRGRLEWTDKDGRVAGLQFTDVSEEFCAEMRSWLSTSQAYAGQPPGKFGAAPAEHALAEKPSSETAEAAVFSRRRDALAKSGSAKSVRPINSIPSNNPAPGSDAFASENPPPADSTHLTWAAVLPPAVGFERRPVVVPEHPAQAASGPAAAAAAFKHAMFDPQAFQPEPAEVPETEESEPAEKAAALPHDRSAARAAGAGNPAAAVEARTAGALNEHAQALLQHFQHEEERQLAVFRESAARVLRDSERQLFPIRESVQAQLKSLASSVAAADASAKVLDQYPSLLERAQQQALDRFQVHIQEVLRAHVTELRRRSELVLEEIDTRVRGTALLPHRIRTSSGIVVAGLILMLLTMLFVFRREAAGAFIWLGDQLVDPAPTTSAPETSGPATSGQTGGQSTGGQATAGSTVPDAKPQDAKPKEEQLPAPTSAMAATRETTASPRDVRSLWNAVGKGDVSAELTLGTMYFTGHGVTKNCSQARRLFAAAARKGSEEGKQRLALLDSGACS